MCYNNNKRDTDERLPPHLYEITPSELGRHTGRSNFFLL